MFHKFKSKLVEVSDEVKRDPRFQSGMASVREMASDLSLTNIGQPYISSSDNVASRISSRYSTTLDQVEIQSTVSDGYLDSDRPCHVRTGSDSLDMIQKFLGPKKPSQTSDVDDLFCLVDDDTIGDQNNDEINVGHEDDLVVKSDDTSDRVDDSADDKTASFLADVPREELVRLILETQRKCRKNKSRGNSFELLSRRISELEEQSQMEKESKRHLEEELRNDIEEKDHVIEALQTKLAIFKANCSQDSGTTVQSLRTLSSSDVQSNEDDASTDIGQIGVSSSSDAVKVNRLENLLAKCKATIEVNKSRVALLTTQLTESRAEISRLVEANEELAKIVDKVKLDELHVAEAKMTMHQELVKKDEQISRLAMSFASVTKEHEETQKKLAATEDLGRRRLAEIKIISDEAAKELDRETCQLENRLRSEYVDKLDQAKEEWKAQQQQLIDELAAESSGQMTKLVKEHELAVNELQARFATRLQEKEAESRLAMKELELRLSSIAQAEDNKTRLLAELESKIAAIDDRDDDSHSRNNSTGSKDVYCRKDSDQTTELLDSKAEIDRLRLQVAELEDKSSTESAIARNVECERLTLALATQQSAYDDLCKALHSLCSQLADTSDLIDLAQDPARVVAAAQHELCELRHKWAASDAALAEDLAKLQAKLVSTENELDLVSARVSNDVDALQSALDTSEAGRASLQKKVDNLERQLAETETRVASAQANDSSGKSRSCCAPLDTSTVNDNVQFQLDSALAQIETLEGELAKTRLAWNDWDCDDDADDDDDSNSDAKDSKLSANSGRLTRPDVSDSGDNYQYLKNVLYHYMLGRDVETMERVLVKLVDFSPEQRCHLAQVRNGV